MKKTKGLIGVFVAKRHEATALAVAKMANKKKVSYSHQLWEIVSRGLEAQHDDA